MDSNNGKAKILVVEDTTASIQIIRAALEDEGYLVFVATSGEKAIKRAGRTMPDLILMDILMPGMDGYETCRQLKANNLTKDIPVLFMSALTDPFDKVRAFRLGARDYITKPIDTEELLARVNTHLTINRLQRDLMEMNRTLEEKVAARTEELQESEERYRHITEAITDYIYRVRVENGTPVETTHSDACFAVTGYTKEEFNADPYLWIKMVFERDHGRVRQQSKDVLSRQFPRAIEHRIIRKDGVVRWVESNIVPTFDTKGDLLYYDGIVRDITGRKELEKRLLHAQKMESIGTLAGGIAHDFNNILTSIIGSTHLVKIKSPKDSQALIFVDNIEKACGRAADLVRQILAFCRLGEQELEQISISPVIKEALKLLRASIPSTIEFRQNIALTGYVLVDPTQIHQIIMNLCTNAYHAMEDTGGIMEITLSEENIIAGPLTKQYNLDPGTYVLLTVSDTGTGIEPSIIDRIFEPYFTTKEKGKGTGLGLSVIHGIVKSYRGAITVSSELSKGTTFKIYLPVIHIEVKPDEKVEETFPEGEGDILFVDDETSVVLLGREILKNLGYNVTGKTDSLEALTLFKENPDKFDLIITDMTMPKMTGLKLAREIMSIRPDVPVILSTGYSEGVSKEMMKQRGFSGLLVKPVSPVKLARTVHAILGKKKLKSALKGSQNREDRVKKEQNSGI